MIKALYAHLTNDDYLVRANAASLLEEQGEVTTRLRAAGLWISEFDAFEWGPVVFQLHEESTQP